MGPGSAFSPSQATEESGLRFALATGPALGSSVFPGPTCALASFAATIEQERQDAGRQPTGSHRPFDVLSGTGRHRASKFPYP